MQHRAPEWWLVLIASLGLAACATRQPRMAQPEAARPDHSQCPGKNSAHPLARPQKAWIVVFADASGIWIDGKRAGGLAQGRIPMRATATETAGCPGLTRKRLKRFFRQAVHRRDPSQWRMRLNVSYSVSQEVVQLVLSEAGRLGVAIVILHRFMEHP